MVKLMELAYKYLYNIERPRREVEQAARRRSFPVLSTGVHRRSQNGNNKILDFQRHLYKIMAKRTKKVGITGKYGTRYGASLRKMVKKMEITQHSKYTCTFCGKEAMKRSVVGVWSCKRCKRTVAGGAWVFSTTTAASVRSAVRRLREVKDQ
ncbi:60S ribosomal protein L37a isoform X1 [Nasonia vitripennis]|uniref:60S ribosomal protein L37a n=6 Tax=Pteromalinae TaxID=272242 RepID=A0A7M7IUW2_NASVI|nr:60S ribosomal protein L37a isoform X1 [Nasonia vitripennis]